MYILKDSLYLTTSIAAILFFYGTAIISWEHLKRSICQGQWVYFPTIIAVIQYNKQSVVDSRKLEGYCAYLWKTIVAMLFFFFKTLLAVVNSLKRGVTTSHLFFQTDLLLSEDQLQPSILSCGVIFLTEQLQRSIPSPVIWNT